MPLSIRWTPSAATALAKSIADIKPTKNDFTGIIGSDSAAQVLFHTPLFADEVQSVLLKMIDLGEKHIDAKLQNGSPKEVSDLATELFKTLKQTVKSGNLDLAGSLRGPDKNGLFTVIGAFSLKDPAGLEKSLKEAVKIVPKPFWTRSKWTCSKLETSTYTNWRLPAR